MTCMRLADALVCIFDRCYIPWLLVVNGTCLTFDLSRRLVKNDESQRAINNGSSEFARRGRVLYGVSRERMDSSESMQRRRRGHCSQPRTTPAMLRTVTYTRADKILAERTSSTWSEVTRCGWK